MGFGWHPIYEMENNKGLKPPVSIYIYIYIQQQL